MKVQCIDDGGFKYLLALMGVYEVRGEYKDTCLISTDRGTFYHQKSQFIILEEEEKE